MLQKIDEIKATIKFQMKKVCIECKYLSIEFSFISNARITKRERFSGFVFVRCDRKCRHDVWWIGSKRAFVNQLFSIATEEALAERAIITHQIDDGTAATIVLIDFEMFVNYE